jgi:hypothetical protein
VENARYPYQVIERHRVNGDRYYTVYLHGKLIIILRNKKAADEYIKLNEKYKNGNGFSS